MFCVPMIFPGQASQHVGMGRDLVQRAGPGAALLAQVDSLLSVQLVRLMLEGPAEELTQTRHAQPAILAHSVAVLRELQSMGIQPTAVAGHSLGEFSAAVAAGALAAEDALRLVRRRGELMYQAGQQQPGAMAAVLGLAAEAVQEICSEISTRHGTVCVANHNSSLQVAISGHTAAVEAAREVLQAAGARKVVPLPVSGAFHSPLLSDAGQQFALDLQRLSWRDLTVPLVANFSAQPVRTADELQAGLARQMTSPVRWHECLQEIVTGLGGPRPRVVLEVGPGKVLTNLAKREHPDVEFVPVSNCGDLDMVLDILAQKLT
jgi:[acyl-carrier-protein] S-malonyltransferase